MPGLPPRPTGFLERLDSFSLIGSTGDGGVERVEASRENGLARAALKARMQEAGLTVRVDPIGNLFGVLELAGPKAPWLFAGSHIDSQPRGGRLDGAYGVLAALETVEAVKARAMTEKSSHNLAIVAWTNEEGARYQPSTLGAATFAGIHELDWSLARQDGAGISVKDALDAIGWRGTDAAPPVPDAYLELHVECGPELERSGARIGVFDHWWGAHKLELVFEGETSHTGPTPMAQRKDALLAAAEVITGLRRLADAAPPGVLHTSVGRSEVEPNSPNVVPSVATLFIELRSVDAEVMTEAHARLMELARLAASFARVRFRVRRDELRPPGSFAPRLRELARAAAARLEVTPKALTTIAAHDAIPLAKVTQTLVVAVPSRAGLCHSPREWTDPADLELGVRWLEEMVLAWLFGP